MPRRMLLALWASLGLLTFATAQELDRPDPGLPPPPLPPYPLPRDAVLPPQPVSLPPDGYCQEHYQYAAPADSPVASARAADRIDHLRQAAEHLEAAGLIEQARELRKQADLAVLAEKREQLKRLQAEIDELSKAAPLGKAAAQVQLKMQLVQVSRDKLSADAAAAILRNVLHPLPDTELPEGKLLSTVALERPGAVEMPSRSYSNQARLRCWPSRCS